MILFFYTLLDFIVLVIMLLGHYNVWDSVTPLAAAALYLFFKGMIFWGDFASVIDLLLGIYLVLMLFGIRWVVTFLAAVWLANKIVASFLG